MTDVATRAIITGDVEAHDEIIDMRNGRPGEDLLRFANGYRFSTILADPPCVGDI
jgi:hypothetical protein